MKPNPMYCVSCGAANRSGARFCNHCGATLTAEATQALRPGQTMNNGQYRVVRQLDTGGMGKVYLAANTQAFDRLCVIKEMLVYYQPDEEAKARQRFEKEARTLATLRHPGIPDMYGFFFENGHHYIVMEYIEGENLAARLTHVDETTGQLIAGQARSQEDVVRYGIQVCRVLEYLASLKPTPVVHNDIKPANIIIDKHSGQAALVDFGTAKIRYSPAGQPPSARKSSVYGTVGYAAPELYNGQSEPRSDVYALAATMYHLITDDDPRDHPFKFPRLQELPDGLRRILEKALATNVNDRLTATAFRQQLEAYRAAHAGSVRPLQFPQGDQVTTITGLLDLSIRHWQYARQILYDGSLENWLRSTLHDPVTANLVRTIVHQFPDNPDAGLDEFVRTLNPRIGAPRLRLLTHHLDFGEITAGGTATQTLSIVNTGLGGAHGEITASAGWLQPASPYFGCGPAERCNIPIQVVDTTVLQAGRHTATVTLRPPVSKPIPVNATVRIRRASPRRVPQPNSRPVYRRSARRRQRHRWPWFAHWWVWIFVIWLLSSMFGSCLARVRSIDLPRPINPGPQSHLVRPMPGPKPMLPAVNRLPGSVQVMGTGAVNGFGERIERISLSAFPLNPFPKSADSLRVASPINDPLNGDLTAICRRFVAAGFRSAMSRPAMGQVPDR